MNKFKKYFLMKDSAGPLPSIVMMFPYSDQGLEDAWTMAEILSRNTQVKHFVTKTITDEKEDENI